MSTLQRIRRKILDRSYRFSHHMEYESMVDHDLLREDVENAILRGRMIVSIVRFASDKNLFFVTVYEL